MKEDFLQFLWQSGMFNQEQLQTVDGLPVKIIRPGTLNKDSGPDFFNSKILLNDTLWVGNTEVHFSSSEWMLHGHQYDTSYNNVVLHVVYEHDEEIINQAGYPIPTLELRNLISPQIMARYNQLQTGNKWISCANLLPDLKMEHMDSFLSKLFIERLEDKIRFIQRDLVMNKQHWEQTFYEYLARNFGFKTNALPFQILAKSLPIEILAKHKADLFQLEALLFGQAGMLSYNFEEDYPQRLKREYNYLKTLYQLEPINQGLWKFATMRPANFPTIRLAQFARLVHQASNLFSKSMSVKSIEDLYKLYDIRLDGYWVNHYQLDQESTAKHKHLGKSSVQNIYINTIAPFMFMYGRDKFHQDICDTSVRMMQEIPPELNGITAKWLEYGFDIKHAFHSQAFIQLKNMYCTPKKCLSCHIGNQLLKKQ